MADLTRQEADIYRLLFLLLGTVETNLMIKCKLRFLIIHMHYKLRDDGPIAYLDDIGFFLPSCSFSHFMAIDIVFDLQMHSG